MIHAITLVALVGLAAPVLSATAQLMANCDNYGTLSRSDDGGATFTTLVGESGWSAWTSSLPYNLGTVTTSTVIRAACRDVGVIGGFIAEVDIDGTKYVTTNPLSAGNWDILPGYSGSLTYRPNGASPWGSASGGIDGSAYWVWNGGATFNTLTFEFSFADLVTDPCAEWGKSLGKPHACKCMDTCDYQETYCNTKDFVAERLKIYAPPNLCGNYQKCCCSCPNCGTFATV